MADYHPDIEKRAEWPAPGRAAVSPFPGDIVPSRRVLLFYPIVIKICSINALELYFFHCIVTFMAMAFNFY